VQICGIYLVAMPACKASDACCLCRIFSNVQVAALVFHWAYLYSTVQAGSSAAHAAPVHHDLLFEYAIVVDAGSGGSRMFFYQMHGAGRNLTVSALTRFSVEPGLSAFVGRPEAAAGYLAPLFNHALAEIPPEQHEDTPVFIKSTAGMRLVPEHEQAQVRNVDGWICYAI
jgi:hypothetical protein